MTGFDYAVLAAVGLSLLLGWWRGFLSEVLALVAWGLAFWAARTWAGEVSPALGGWFADPGVRYLATFVGLFLVVVIALAGLRWLLREMVRAVGLGLVDRFLGAMFGVVRGGVVVLAGVLLGGLTSLPREPWWRDAVLAPPLETAVIAGKPWLPAQVAKQIHYR